MAKEPKRPTKQEVIARLRQKAREMPKIPWKVTPEQKAQLKKLKMELPPGVTLDISVDYGGRKAAKAKRITGK